MREGRRGAMLTGRGKEKKGIEGRQGKEGSEGMETWDMCEGRRGPDLC